MFESRDLFDFEQDPIDNFRRLYAEASKHRDFDPNAMTLATIGPQGHPNARIVLLQSFAQDEFVFFSHYTSTKGVEIEAHPNVCLLFHWSPLMVQIRIEGQALRVSRADSENYFKSCSRETQLAAWVSSQSEFVDSYETLELRLAQLREHYEGQVIPCPDDWGGYRVIPDLWEFWFAMQGALHFRAVYERSGQHWLRTMKAP